MVFFALLVVMAWFFADRAFQYITVSIRQSAETTLVDLSQILATHLEQEVMANGEINTANFAAFLHQAMQRRFDADVYQFHKKKIDFQVYVTNQKGIVIYDSEGKAVGQDYSQWRDVYYTLRGEYGARNSFMDAEHTEEDDPKMMVVGAPILFHGDIIGVLSVAQPNQQFEFFRLSGFRELRTIVWLGIFLAVGVILLMSWWLTHALERLSSYAEAMAQNKAAKKPIFHDKHFAQLSDAIDYLRRELDGKEYVERYIHGLTHELKIPMTGIRAAAEFLHEADLSAKEREDLLARIEHSNRRMQALVDRILALAKLENQQSIEKPKAVNLKALTQQVLASLQLSLTEKQIAVDSSQLRNLTVQGDAFLLRQAIANVLGNAVSFCPQQGVLKIASAVDDKRITLTVYNAGEAIPDYALPRLFERFFSLPRPDGSPRSSGLGLSFVQQIMALHHGKIKLENAPGGVLATLTWFKTAFST